MDGRGSCAAVLAVLLSACSGGSAASQGSGATHGASAGGTYGADAAVSRDEDATTATQGAPDGGFNAPTGPQAQQAMQRFAEGSSAFQHGDFPAAATAFRAAYDLAPSPEMAFNLARVYERIGEVDQGVHFFEIVLASGPAPEARADVEHRIAGLRAYEQRRREGIAQPPPSTDALSAEGARWFTNGVTFYRRHQYAQALVAFQQAYQYLQTPELLFNLAASNERQHHYDQAIEFLREYQQQRRGTAEEAQIQLHIEELEQRR